MWNDYSDALRDLLPFAQFKKREKYGGVLHFVKLQAKAYKLKPTTLLKVALLRAFFHVYQIM